MNASPTDGEVTAGSGAGAELDLGHTRLDLSRARRTGLPEAIFASGKTPEQCVEIVTELLECSTDPLIVTRCSLDHHDALAPLEPHHVASSTLTWNHATPDPAEAAAPVVVVSAGTSDEPVVDECAATLRAHGVQVRVVRDVGVAGLHRLLAAMDQLEDASVVVAVAGMEGALPTVLAGLVPSPIVAVPTSVGYGASLEGVTALLSMLSSCSPGVAVVGIDNGYGAACAVLRILRGSS